MIDNVLLQAKSGMLAGNLLLSFCNLDPTPALLKQLGDSRGLFAENAVNFFPMNISVLLNLIANTGQLQAELGEVLIVVISILSTQLQESISIFKA
jgi:hypothetical protein